MENLTRHTPYTLPFAYLLAKLRNYLREKGEKMLCIKLKKFLVFSVMVFAVSSILFATNSFAEDKALFSDLTNHGAKIFGGMREIIYAVSGFGIVAIAIGSFFGTLNWKWLVAIIIGLVVIALTAGIINYMVDSDVITDEMITDSLISANDNQK